MKKLVLVLLVLGIVLPATAAVGTTILANDDVTVRGTTVYNNTSVFGLMAKTSADVFYVEFTLGSTAASSATLELDQSYAAGAGWGVSFLAGEYNFNDESFVIPVYSGWTNVGTISGVGAMGIYTLDVTSWYNANLGKTMTLRGYTSTTGSGSAPIYNDSEGMYAGRAVPAIVVVPEPATLLVLSAGALMALRRKR